METDRVMKCRIENLQKISLKDRLSWGGKAAFLGDASKHGITIPDGFCLALAKGASCQSVECVDKIGRAFQDLRQRTGAQFYIVRSSAQYEDSKHHAFPGIYKSKGDITSLPELLEAIQICYDGFYTEIAATYKKEMQIPTTEQEQLCLIVQEQCEPKYSGVLFTAIPMPGYEKVAGYLVEITVGHCRNMLQGSVSADMYLLKQKGDTFYAQPVNRSASSELPEQDTLQYLGEIIHKLITLYGQYLDVEWCDTGKELVILQIRPISSHATPFSVVRKDNVELGLKAEAMRRFRDMGLFEGTLLVLEPGNAKETARQSLEITPGLGSRITVRYSCSGQLGLPRCFVTGKMQALEFINNTWQPDWAIIIHESIDVRNSFELYMDEEKAILEHIPGMWESDNTLCTDLWIFQDRQITAYAAGGVRWAKYEDAQSVTYQAVEAYTEADMQRIAMQMLPYIQCLRSKWPAKNGDNFHFVQNKEGRFFFLNHRRTARISRLQENSEFLLTITCKEDLKKWNGESLLFKINMKRGEEDIIKEYVPFLRRTQAKVYVPFGILSHPSILLREMGITVYPEYISRKKYYFKF